MCLHACHVPEPSPHADVHADSGRDDGRKGPAPHIFMSEDHMEHQAQLPSSNLIASAAFRRIYCLKLLVGQRKAGNSQPSIFSSFQKRMNMLLLNMPVSLDLPDAPQVKANLPGTPSSSRQIPRVEAPSSAWEASSSPHPPNIRSPYVAVESLGWSEARTLRALQGLRSHLDTRLDRLEAGVDMLSCRMLRIEKHLVIGN